MKQVLSVALLSASLTAALSISASAQNFPTKPVTMYVIVATGNPMSSLARLIADKLEQKWKQTVIVENKPGGGGLVATELIKRADPDGHSLLFTADAMTAYRLFNKDTNFDPNNDLAPVSLVAEVKALAVFTNAKVPAKTLDEFIAYGKANPGKMNFAVLPQSQQQLESIKFLKWAGLDMAAVPYPGGSGTVLPALLTNDVQMYLASWTAMSQHVATGALLPLVQFSDKREPEMPNVPTLKEKGSDQVTSFWYAFFAPKATPAAITNKISADMQEVMKQPEMMERVKGLGMVPQAMTPQETAARVARDTAVRTQIAKDANIQPQ